MTTSLPEGVLRRLLMVRQLLEAIPSLTPTSDALAVARAILAAHDAAELALATIADSLAVRRKDRMYLMDYASALRDHLGDRLPGYDYFSQLNDERVSFKHKGNLPNVQQWHTVGDNARRYVEQWCHDHLGISLADLALDVLIESQEARALYLRAKERCDAGDYKSALEVLGQALYAVLNDLPGAFLPLVGKEHVQDALRLAAFGVNAGDFLTLQQLLPSVRRDLEHGGFTVTWERRGTGHPANWTEENVRFCLATFVDVAIKTQHAPWSPWPVGFHFVYENIATAKRDGATVWREPGPMDVFQGRQREPVRELKKGEVLRGLLMPVADPRATPGTFGALMGPPSFENATAYYFHSGDRSGHLYVADFEIGAEPKDEEWVRRMFPHVFPAK